ncbi:MAG: MOSC domain-containing protein [Clostridia bacterium]|nr:MOSC domain-containing protein [Clostridia bacterium]
MQKKTNFAGEGRVLAVCISDKKGIQKSQMPEIRLIEDWGIEGDAHAGNWHRQVSLLAFEKIEAFRSRGANVEFGAFGENLVVEGFDLRTVPVGTRFKVGEALLELTQIGKECHSHCEIYKVMGDCIMPREGVFAKVLKGGTVRPGDRVERLSLDPDRPFTAAVVVLSDKGFRGEREDKSGPLICEILTEQGYEVVEMLLLPDERPALETALIQLADRRQVDVIFTTGGTGFSERDITPEATLAVCDRMAPGIAEAMRYYSLQITPRAMLSRQTSGIRKKTLIVNLPGSPKACKEDLDFILPSLGHGLGILRGTDGECGTDVLREHNHDPETKR